MCVLTRASEENWRKTHPFLNRFCRCERCSRELPATLGVLNLTSSESDVSPLQRSLSNRDFLHVSGVLSESSLRTLASNLGVPEFVVDDNLILCGLIRPAALEVFQCWWRSLESDDDNEAWSVLYKALIDSGLELVAQIILGQPGQKSLAFAFACSFANHIMFC